MVPGPDARCPASDQVLPLVCGWEHFGHGRGYVADSEHANRRCDSPSFKFWPTNLHCGSFGRSSGRLTPELWRGRGRTQTLRAKAVRPQEATRVLVQTAIKKAGAGRRTVTCYCLRCGEGADFDVATARARGARVSSSMRGADIDRRLAGARGLGGGERGGW